MSRSVVIWAPQLVKPSGIAAVPSVLYWSWLVAPVVRYLAENEWRAVGFCAAVVAGDLIGYWSSDRFPAACETIIGLLFCGTWAKLLIRTGVPISFITAATMHTKSFWLWLVPAVPQAIYGLAAGLVIRIKLNSQSGTTAVTSISTFASSSIKPMTCTAVIAG